MSRFFNNLSYFNMVSCPVEQVMPGFGEDQGYLWKECLPSKCLGPNGRGADNLVVTNKIINVGDGRSFIQPSLSNYFKALNKCSYIDQKNIQDNRKDNIFFPTRTFDPECLMTKSNESILDKLLDKCELLIIQDADLRPDQLKDHLKIIKKPEISAIDMTKNLGLRRHYSYALMPSQKSVINALQGDKLC